MLPSLQPPARALPWRAPYATGRAQKATPVSAALNAPMQPSRLKAFALIILAYALALAAAWGATLAVPSAHPLLKVALGTVVGTLVVFAFSRAFDNTSLYDPYWSVAPLVAALYLYAGPGAGGARALGLVSLIALW